MKDYLTMIMECTVQKSAMIVAFKRPTFHQNLLINFFSLSSYFQEALLFVNSNL